LVIPVGDDGVNQKSRPTFFFLRNTYAQQAAAPNSNKLHFRRPYQLINILPKNVSALYNALHRALRAALQRVAARLNATQRAAVVEIDLKSVSEV